MNIVAATAMKMMPISLRAHAHLTKCMILGSAMAATINASPALSHALKVR